MKKLYDLLGFMVFIFIIGVISAALFNFYNYVDLTNSCVIRVNRNVFNKTNSTREKLREIKKENPEAYKIVCQNISKITEIKCRESEFGCYLRGTKEIYLDHYAKHGESKEALVNYAYMSKNYHEGEGGVYLQIFKQIIKHR